MRSPVRRSRKFRSVLIIVSSVVTLTCFLVFLRPHTASNPSNAISSDFVDPIVTESSPHGIPSFLPPNHAEEDKIGIPQIISPSRPQNILDLSAEGLLPTEIIAHRPGCTVFRNLYMSGGTLFIVTSAPTSFPEISEMSSTGLPLDSYDMDFLTPEDAQIIWGENGRDSSRVLPIIGTTWLLNDPPHFLSDYHSFCAELLTGTWAFWAGAFNSTFTPYGKTSTPVLDRAIFIHSGSDWRDRAGFNPYFLRTAFPSLAVETNLDWRDRVTATYAPDLRRSKSFRFDTVLLADRTVVLDDRDFLTVGHHVASTVNQMRDSGRLSKWWWEPIRRAVVSFTGVDEMTVNIGARAHGVIDERDQMKGIPLSSRPFHQNVVVTYINGQGSDHRLIDDDHDYLVAALRDLCSTRGWQSNVIVVDELTREEQIRIMARTTILLGLHNSGLSHLILLPITPRTTVIEIVHPGEISQEYRWTAQTIGFKYYAVMGNKYSEDLLAPEDRPEMLPGEDIEVDAATVVELIEARIDKKL